MQAEDRDMLLAEMSQSEPDLSSLIRSAFTPLSLQSYSIAGAKLGDVLNLLFNV